MTTNIPPKITTTTTVSTGKTTPQPALVKEGLTVNGRRVSTESAKTAPQKSLLTRIMNALRNIMRNFNWSSPMTTPQAKQLSPKDTAHQISQANDMAIKELIISKERPSSKALSMMASKNDLSKWTYQSFKELSDVGTTNTIGIDSFRKLLKNELGIESIKEFTEKTLCQENLKFLFAVNDFNKSPSIEKYNMIVSAFIKPGAEQQINISNTEVNNILEVNPNDPNSLKNVFTTSNNEITRVLHENLNLGQDTFQEIRSKILEENQKLYQ